MTVLPARQSDVPVYRSFAASLIVPVNIVSRPNRAASWLLAFDSCLLT